MINDFHREMGTAQSAASPTTLKDATEFVTKSHKHKGGTPSPKDTQVRRKVQGYAERVKASAKKALSKQQNETARRIRETPMPRARVAIRGAVVA